MGEKCHFINIANENARKHCFLAEKCVKNKNHHHREGTRQAISGEL